MNKPSRLSSILFDVTKASTKQNKFCAASKFFIQKYNFMCGLSVKSEDRKGSLAKILAHFSNCKINLTNIQSKSLPFEPHKTLFNIYYDEEDAEKTREVIKRLKMDQLSDEIVHLKPTTIPWFPHNESDLSSLNLNTLTHEEMLAVDHPGVKDQDYIARRQEIARVSSGYKEGPLPYIKYTEKENKLWNNIFDKLTSMYPKYACSEFNTAFNELVAAGIYKPNKIPQIRDVSEYLTQKTGFKLRPVTGLLESRDFLNALAFKVFNATQYLRHSSRPFYTPEPDLVHELMGHCALFANKEFADFTQLIGLASLGATDEQIEKLARLYWYTNEFGLLYENDQLKAYGAGVLSSVAELEAATTNQNPEVKIKNLQVSIAAHTPFPIHNLQEMYFAAKSLEDVRIQCLDFTQTFLKPFSFKYLPNKNEVVFTTFVEHSK